MLTRVFLCSHIVGLSSYIYCIYCGGFKIVFYRENVTSACDHLFANLPHIYIYTYIYIYIYIILANLNVEYSDSRSDASSSNDSMEANVWKNKIIQKVLTQKNKILKMCQITKEQK